MLVDSHCHLNYLDEPEGRLDAARARGVGAVLCIGVDRDGIAGVLDLAATQPDVWASVGQHPEAAGADTAWVEPLLGTERVVAIGETGLDYHHVESSEPSKSSDYYQQQARQREAFAFQLSLAQRHDLPVIVHTRAAERDTLDLMRAHPGVRGVLHCFTESWEMAEQALELGYYVSISGIVTFKNGANVREVAKRIPEDRLLLETDAPWLAPVPHRGRPNEPAFVVDTARFVAGLRDCSIDRIAAATTENFFRLFAAAKRVAAPE